MNIGIDIRCLMDKEKTGVGEYTYELLNAIFLLDKKNQYYLFYNSSQDVSSNIPKWNQENVHYVGLKWPNKLLNLLLWLKMVKLNKLVIRKAKLLPFPPLVGEGRVGFDIWFSPNLNFTNLSKKIKYIQTVHDLSFEFLPECFTWKQRLWHWILNPRRQCKRADIIVTPSENTKQDVCEVYKVHQVNKVIKLGPGVLGELGMANEEEIRMKYNLPEKYILYLGTLEPRKNVKTIIEAYNVSELKSKNYELIIAGSRGWKNKKLLKLIQETPGVKYLEYVNEDKKKELYKKAALFVFPSLYEGFGLPVLEAMSYSLPVITSNRSSLPEVAGQAEYLINPHNILELEKAMRLILSDDNLRGILIEQGKNQSQKFNWEKSAQQFLNLICA